jgi:hypothetical protein
MFDVAPPRILAKMEGRRRIHLPIISVCPDKHTFRCNRLLTISPPEAHMRTWMFLAVGLLLCSVSSKTPAQTTPEWSQWISVGPDYPSLDWRVRCWAGSEKHVSGTTVSWWDFEFRSRYTISVDYVYQTVDGDPSTRKNYWAGPFMNTLQPGQKSDPGYAILIGPCSQHYGRGNGLWMDVKCVVPTGQDAPCFTNNGQPVRRLQPDELNQFGLSRPSGGGSSSKSGGKQLYWFCWSSVAVSPTRTHLYVSKVFSEPAEGPDTGDAETLLDQFREWTDSNFGHHESTAGNCLSYKTSEEATKNRQEYANVNDPSGGKAQAMNWPANEQAP